MFLKHDQKTIVALFMLVAIMLVAVVHKIRSLDTSVNGNSEFVQQILNSRVGIGDIRLVQVEEALEGKFTIHILLTKPEDSIFWKNEYTGVILSYEYDDLTPSVISHALRTDAFCLHSTCKLIGTLTNVQDELLFSDLTSRTGSSVSLASYISMGKVEGR